MSTPPPYTKFCRLAHYPDSSNPVVFYGLSNAWPEYPFRKPARVGSSMQMMAGWSGSAPIPGRQVRQDYGAHETNATFDLNIPMASEALVLAVMALYTAGGLMYFTHDWTMTWDTPSGTTGSYTNLWVVCWDPGDSGIKIEENAGFPIVAPFKMKLRFGVLQKTT